LGSFALFETLGGLEGSKWGLFGYLKTPRRAIELKGIFLELFFAVLGCIELFWAVLGCFGLFWAVLGCFALF
jgi:hypothetical protein